MPNVHDDDEESLWFADESEWMDDGPDDGFEQAAAEDFERAAREHERKYNAEHKRGQS